MIHRFVDLLDEVTPVPYWPIMVDTNNSPEVHWFVYTIGNGLPPFRAGGNETKLSINSTLSDPRLSPDFTEIAYGYTQDPAFGANNQNIRVIQRDGTGSREDLVTDTVVPLNGFAALSTAWSPDGAKIAWSPRPAASSGTSSRGMVKTVNRDGTGMTTLFTAPSNQQSVANISYSPSGDYIAFTVHPLGGFPQIWVMEDDGTNAANIFTSSLSGLGIIPSWQRNADVIGFLDRSITLGGTGTMYTVNPDGSSLTSIFSDVGNFYSGQGLLAWLSDDSAMACMKRTNGTYILDATDWVLALIDGAGGGATVSGLATGTLGGGAQAFLPPWVAVTPYEAPRIFYPQTTNEVASVLEDLSDYRVDFDPDDPTLTDGETTDYWQGQSS